MDGVTQNKIEKMVHKLRGILEKEMAEILEGVYGLHRDGTIENITNLPKIRGNKKSLRSREGFAYFLKEETITGVSPPEALKKLILNLTFTHLNRLFALKLMERRKVIGETTGRLHKSNDFIHYIVQVLGKKDFSEIENIDEAYEDFILYQCHKTSKEIRVLFSEEDLSACIFPLPRTLKEILEIINSSDLDELWDKDETIGWFYQYFTPVDMRKKARAESDVPRNSNELAFRNQFYTPRYVVQYLVDNTLGRMWYEMTGGKTIITGFCKYLVRPPQEIFLQKGEKSGENKEIFYVPFREKKDPRKLKILDPACGSGHFLLYVFDLLKEIYKEAYEDEKAGKKLREDYPNKEDFEREIPGLILENNLYGIDIDMRAIQIAALALWLRAQREWNDMGIAREDRPKVRKIHFVCAEPMPGNREEFESFVSTLKPALLGDFLRDIWEKMRLAGEAGALLQIEKDLRNTIKRAKEEYKKLSKGQLSFWEEGAKQTEFDFSDIIDKDFFREAEENVLKSLWTYAREAEEKSYSRMLFAEETARGFDFIEILRERFDVVLMNPPFGEGIPAVKKFFGDLYPEWNRNILCAFIHRMLDITGQDGFVGAIFDRTAIVKSSYEKFRKNILIDRNVIFSMAD
ncbi:MAG: DNA methyltransferase, partial [Candidatus Eremiobacterota bacterium]